MREPKILDEMAERLSKIIPQGVREVQQDVQNNIRAALNSTFEKLNLVTREEFEVQSAVLARTRAKLRTLEEKIAALEAELPTHRDVLVSREAGCRERLKQRTEE